MRLLLIGCTGFIGRELVPQLLSAGHHVTLVSRKDQKGFDQNLSSHQLIWLQQNPAELINWEQGELWTALNKADGVINLAGEPIAEKRWTATHCQEIKNSRLNTTNGLVNALGQLRRPPRVLINASAVGYYGTSQDALFNENSINGNDFLAKLCNEWEATANKKPRSSRLIIFRIGIVLGPDGGALKKMLPVFKAGLGGPIGDGDQWMSWIHRTDLCQMIQQALTNKSWSGVINAVSPSAVSMSKFAAVLGKSLGRPSLLPVPGALLKLLLGDGARVVLEGQQVESIRLNQIGFKFQYAKLDQALAAIINPVKDQ
ncbi:TIGR01777 family oxidoreductase [Prochlorococcus sp. MIT 1307]|uniref:TIGR01777 family oxidoreductase n=1 Tax=Prochlorococcus sp. MIT 1307 TaxID=3096219 RepID=UPI002A74A3A8|nr:TIGR01777 family oxidoreductase [Prochlorococcus sp. MIT 1307]